MPNGWLATTIAAPVFGIQPTSLSAAMEFTSNARSSDSKIFVPRPSRDDSYRWLQSSLRHQHSRPSGGVREAVDKTVDSSGVLFLGRSMIPM